MFRLALTATALLTASAVTAQPIDRTKPPETLPVPSIKLPATFEKKLPNGLTLVLVEDRRFPLVTARLAINAGYKYEAVEQTGLAEAVSETLIEGTKTRTSRQIAEEATSIGGGVAAGLASDTITLNGSALSEYAMRMLDLLADVARNANFPADEVKLYQQNRQQRLLEQRSQSETVLGEKFSEVIFGNSPYRTRIPTAADVDRLTPEMLGKYRDTYFAPNNSVLLLLGRLPPRAQLLKAIEAKFGDWKAKTVPAARADAPPAPGRRVVVVDRPGSVQADVQVGHLGIPRSNADFFPLLVGNSILGGGASSRLFNDIREKRGFAYSVYSFHQPSKEAGMFAAGMQVRNEVLTPALDAMLDHLGRMGKEPVTGQELSDVKNYLSGNFVLRLERQEAMASQLILLKTMGLPADYLETYTTRIRSVEPDQIERVAKKYLNPDETAIVVVGDAAKTAPAVEKFGKPEITKPAQ